MESVNQTSRGKRILIVEDDASIRALCSIVLADDGCEVDIAANGAEGRRLIEGNQHDLFLFDLKMLGMTGYDLFRWLQAERPQLVGKVVFMTGAVMADDTSGFLRDACRPVLSKPFTPKQLTAAVRDALGSAPG